MMQDVKSLMVSESGEVVLTKQERQKLRTLRRAQLKAEAAALAVADLSLSKERRNELRRKREAHLARVAESKRRAEELRKQPSAAKMAEKAKRLEERRQREAEEKQRRMWKHQALMARPRGDAKEALKNDLGAVDSL